MITHQKRCFYNVDVNGYYFDNGYDKIKKKNCGHYEDGDDFLHSRISKNYETATLP